MTGSSFKLLRYFSITSFVAMIIVTPVLAMLYRYIAIEDLVTLGERNNIALTQMFSNSLWPDFGAFLTSASGLSDDALRDHPETTRLHRAVRELMKDLSVVKIKVYDLAGRTVFSTEAKQIGEDKSANAGFLSARSGKVANEITHRDTFSAFDAVIEDRDLISSYVPIRRGGPAGAVEAVFELYYDVTPLLQKIDRTQRIVVVAVIFVLAGLYSVLFFIVKRADRIIENQYIELATVNRELEKANEMQADFSAMIAHDLRSPLTAVLSAAAILRDGLVGAVNEEQKNWLGKIEAQSRNLVNLVNDFLDLSKIESGHIELVKESVDLDQLIRSSLDNYLPLSKDKKVSVRSCVAPALSQIKADPRRLDQVFSNLISNAIKFTPEGGEIEVGADRENGLGVKVWVRDNGVGIAPEEIGQIFEKYRQTTSGKESKHKGTGLGLVISKMIVEAHGGRIWVESEQGKGTTFTFTIPCEIEKRFAPP